MRRLTDVDGGLIWVYVEDNYKHESAPASLSYDDLFFLMGNILPAFQAGQKIIAFDASEDEKKMDLIISMINCGPSLITEVLKLRRNVSILRRALEFYADGDRARAALVETEME